MGFVTALVYFALVLLAIGTALAFLTSWRAGCLGRDLAQLTSGLVWVYLSIKQFAQQKNTDYHMRFLVYWPFMILFYLPCLPICVIIALMDGNNGRGFRVNLREVMGQPQPPAE